MLTTLDWNKSFGELQPELAPAYTLIILPIVYIILMYRFRDRLTQKSVIKRIGSIYAGVAIHKNRWAKYSNPIWLLRRCTFVFLPILFSPMPYFQLIGLVFLQSFFMMWHTHVMPSLDNTVNKLEVWNCLCVLFLSYHMMCFTWFVLEKEDQFTVGVSFLVNLLMILVVNCGNVVRNSIKETLAKRKKAAVQKAYE